MARCPKCQKLGLLHTLVEESLPAHACPECDGLLIGLVAYRRWREASKRIEKSRGPETTLAPVEDSKEAKQCPKCRGVMTKYKVSADVSNQIDFCVNCEDVWLDNGEWELIDTLVGSEYLAAIITQPWQHKIRQTRTKRMEENRLSSLLEDEYEKVLELANWLDGHEARDEILAYLHKHSS